MRGRLWKERRYIRSNTRISKASTVLFYSWVGPYKRKTSWVPWDPRFLWEEKGVDYHICSTFHCKKKSQSQEACRYSLRSAVLHNYFVFASWANKWQIINYQTIIYTKNQVKIILILKKIKRGSLIELSVVSLSQGCKGTGWFGIFGVYKFL